MLCEAIQNSCHAVIAFIFSRRIVPEKCLQHHSEMSFREHINVLALSAREKTQHHTSHYIRKNDLLVLPCSLQVHFRWAVKNLHPDMYSFNMLQFLMILRTFIQLFTCLYNLLFLTSSVLPITPMGTIKRFQIKQQKHNISYCFSSWTSSTENWLPTASF